MAAGCAGAVFTLGDAIAACEAVEELDAQPATPKPTSVASAVLIRTRVKVEGMSSLLIP
jgi:hypothetical protein